MPMWMSWVNPSTQKRERIYNYFDQETEEGQKSIDIARRALAKRFDIPSDRIPGFNVEPASWISPAPSGSSAGGTAGGMDESEAIERRYALLAPLTPEERRDLLRVVRRGREISKRVMTEMPDEFESLVKDGMLPGSHAWWLVMYTIAADELGVDWMRLVEET